MRTPLVILGGVGWLAVSIVFPAVSRAGNLIIGNTDSFYDDLSVPALGARTADTILSGAYCFGPQPIGWSRAIVPFSRSAFAPIADGRPILAAKLLYVVQEDFLEPGETAASEVRLFTTNEPPLDLDNRDVFADLTGDGGAHVVAGIANFAAGATGFSGIELAAEAVETLQQAINGDEQTIGFAFREYAGDDELDETCLLADGSSVGILITVPDPVVPPICEVRTTKSVYTYGEPVGLRHLRFANPDAALLPARLQVEIVTPNGAVRPMDFTVPLNAGFHVELGPLPLFPVVSGVPAGRYQVRCAVVDPVTQAVFREDVASFTIR